MNILITILFHLTFMPYVDYLDRGATALHRYFRRTPDATKGDRRGQAARRNQRGVG
jgi:hypothetical protein